MKQQNGYTLLEILVMLPVTAVLVGAIVGSMFLIARNTIEIRNETTVHAAIDNAAHWLTRDILMGQSIDILEGAPAVDTVRLTWTDFTGGVGNEQSHYVIYTHSGTQLWREYDSIDNSYVIARDMEDVSFTISGDVVTVILTCTLEYAPSSTVTRSYEIEMRTREE